MLPPELSADHALFWDADVDAIDSERHAPYVIARVLDLGTLVQVRAIERFYGRERLRSFFLEGGLRRVEPRTAAFWLHILGLPRQACESTSSPRPSSKRWND